MFTKRIARLPLLLRHYTTQTDIHNCLHWKLQTPMQLSDFQSRLSSLIHEQTSQQKKALWIHLNRANLQLVSSAVSQHQFKIHKAQGDSVILYRWLDKLSDMVPKHSKFYSACGGILIRNGRVLMVQQSNGIRKGQWGVPSGYMQQNQPISIATEREFREETNLNTKFHHLMYVREIMGPNCSEYYFASLLELPEGEERNLKICNRELSAYEWVELGMTDEFIEDRKINFQAHLLRYLSKLYREGFQFYRRKPTVMREKEYGVNGVKRYFIEHRLAETKR